MLYLMFNTPFWAQVEDVLVPDLKARMAEGIPVIDIRRPEEWEETGIIPGSRLLTFFDADDGYDLEAWLEGFDQVANRDEPFILVCRTGIRTRRLGRFLDGRLEFSRSCHLFSGITGWIDDDRPVAELPDAESGS